MPESLATTMQRIAGDAMPMPASTAAPGNAALGIGIVCSKPARLASSGNGHARIEQLRQRAARRQGGALVEGRFQPPMTATALALQRMQLLDECEHRAALQKGVGLGIDAGSWAGCIIAWVRRDSAIMPCSRCACATKDRTQAQPRAYA